jgi:hypothetical protein
MGLATGGGAGCCCEAVCWSAQPLCAAHIRGSPSHAPHLVWPVRDILGDRVWCGLLLVCLTQTPYQNSAYSRRQSSLA